MRNQSEDEQVSRDQKATLAQLRKLGWRDNAWWALPNRALSKAQRSSEDIEEYKFPPKPSRKY